MMFRLVLLFPLLLALSACGGSPAEGDVPPAPVAGVEFSAPTPFATATPWPTFTPAPTATPAPPADADAGPRLPPAPPGPGIRAGCPFPGWASRRPPPVP